MRTGNPSIWCSRHGEPRGRRQPRPSVEAPSHIVLYKAFPTSGRRTHHSHYATAWRKHAGPFPCRHDPCRLFPRRSPRDATADRSRGALQLRREHRESHCAPICRSGPAAVPGAVLCAKHAPFTWGDTRRESHPRMRMSSRKSPGWPSTTLMLAPQQEPIDSFLLDKHFLRKHRRRRVLRPKEVEARSKGAPPTQASVHRPQSIFGIAASARFKAASSSSMSSSRPLRYASYAAHVKVPVTAQIEQNGLGLARLLALESLVDGRADGVRAFRRGHDALGARRT